MVQPSSIEIKELIDSGVHFGHKVSRRHPKMEPYIFDKRNQIHIIDLRETVKGVLRAANFLNRMVASGRDVVFVGTKRQAKALVQREAQRSGMHWVSERWLGGTLTNYHTIRERLKRLEELENLEKTGDIENYSKKRISAIRRELRKITRNLEGIRKMRQLPGCLVVVDINKEYIAVREARKTGIPVIGLVDTDCDPTQVDLSIPCNDDAYRSIQLILKQLTDAIIAGRDKAVSDQHIAEKASMDDRPLDAAHDDKGIGALAAYAGGAKGKANPVGA